MADTRVFVDRRYAQAPFFVGVDLGGTNVKFGVVDDLGRPMSWTSMPTDAVAGPDGAIARMNDAVRRVVAEAGLSVDEIARVGLGSPGTMDLPTGMLLDPPNLPGWQNFPIRDRLRAAVGVPVAFANDANAAAYGEFWVGSGRELSSMVLFTLGTGVGCGIIIGDLAIEGTHSTGAECGHIVIDYRDDARMCPCGQPGHLEAYCSATAVVRRTREALEQGRASSLAASFAAGEELSTVAIAAAAEAGDELALDVIMETARLFGVGVTSVMHVVDPDGVVIGGAMTFGGHAAPLGRKFLEAVRAEVRRRAFPVLAERTKIDFAQLGGDAGFIGAAGLARLAHRRLHRIGNVER
jgi:glucokinase